MSGAARTTQMHIDLPYLSLSVACNLFVIAINVIKILFPGRNCKIGKIHVVAKKNIQLFGLSGKICGWQKLFSYLDNKVYISGRMGTKVPLYECHHWIILKGKSEPDNQHEILTLQQIYHKIFVFVMIFIDFYIEGSILQILGF